jgi:hypothetical protein
MSTKNLFNFTQIPRHQKQQNDPQRINGIAGLLFTILLIIATGGIFYLDNRGASVGTLATFFTVAFLIGLYFLLAL